MNCEKREGKTSGLKRVDAAQPVQSLHHFFTGSFV